MVDASQSEAPPGDTRRTRFEVPLAIGTIAGGILILVGAPAVFRYLQSPTSGALLGWCTVMVAIISILWAAVMPFSRTRSGPISYQVISLGVAVAGYGVAWALTSQRNSLQGVRTLVSNPSVIPSPNLAILGSLIVALGAISWLAFDLIRSRWTVKK